MNFKVLNGDIYFPNEFIKLNEIRGEFLHEAFNSVSILGEELTKNFSSIDQLLKDGENFGYNFLNKYILKAINIINELGVKEIDNNTFLKDYYLNNYFTWEKTLEGINKDTLKVDEDNKSSIEDVSYNRLNINSELIKKPFNLHEKNIIINDNNIITTIPIETISKLVNSMVESIFNINFAIIDLLKDKNVDKVAQYNSTEEINKSNKLIKSLLNGEISKDNEIDVISEIIKLNPYNENIYKALLYKYGDYNDQIEELGSFLGYNNIHEYKHKLLDEYYRNLNTEKSEDIIKSKEDLIKFANKLNISDYSEYTDELDNMFVENGKLVDSIENKDIDRTVKMATIDVDRENNKLKKKKVNKNNKVLFYLSTVVSCLVVIYLIMTVFFSTHFFFRTSINGVDVSGKSNKTVQSLMAVKADEYSLTIKERNNITENINGADISLKYDFTNGINEILENQNPFLWVKSIFKNNKNTIVNGISYDEALLKQIIGNLNAFNEENINDPVNAYINYTDSGYEIVKEDIGNRIKFDEFYSKVLDNIQNIDKEFDLEEEECYENPKYTSETKAVIEAKNTADKYIKAKITYNVNGNEEIIDSSMISSWIDIDEEFNVNINEEAIREYVNALGTKYDYLGNYRDFTRWSGEAIKVSTTSGIYYIDRDTTINEITEAIKSGKEESKELIFKTPSATDEYVINTFVEVDLSNQTVVYYKNGNLITQGNVVTGDISAGNDTPAGVYRLDWKAKDFVLRGEDYEAPVSFWMPFNGGIGLHDASWRSEFGGSVYQTNGSHGCINMPYSVAEAIYNNIEDRTTIICRY